MLKRLLVLMFVVPAAGLTAPNPAFAARTITGHVSAFSATSLAVFDKETVTVALDERTTFTKLITQKPWQQDTRLDASALRVGQYVAVHVRGDGRTADWVEIATDRPLEPPPVPARATTADDHLRLSTYFTNEAAKYEADANEHLAMASAYRREPNPAETKRPGAPGTSVHCDRIAASLRAAAAEARVLAAEHARMAAAVR